MDREEKAPLVYRLKDTIAPISFAVRAGRGREREDEQGRSWDLLRGEVTGTRGRGTKLERAPYVPTYIEAWTTTIRRLWVLRRE